MNWDSLGPLVFVPMWRKFVNQHSTLLSGFSLGRVPELLQQLPKIAAQMRDPEGQLPSRQQRENRAADLIWMAVAVTLIGSGWTVHMEPGVLYVEREGTRLVPPESIQKLRSAALTSTEWLAWCEGHGVAEKSLNPDDEVVAGDACKAGAPGW